MPPDKAPDQAEPTETPIPREDIEQVMQALKKLPHGDNLPSWYPPELLSGG